LDKYTSFFRLEKYFKRPHSFLSHYTSEDDSESEDEELCPLDDEEDDHVSEVQQDEDDHVAKIQQDEEQNLDEVQLEEDEQLARAIQESLSIGSPPRSQTDSIFQPFTNLFPPVYR
jgi:hypothetical protein